MGIRVIYKMELLIQKVKVIYKTLTELESLLKYHSDSDVWL